ncbi:MAG: acyltransferase family protein, partial [Alphaproteobacteria bacterium]|nr:acyltransferase family protein [Alphaproteobacteria bacterium]
NYCAIDAHGHPLFFQCVYPFGLILGETGVPSFFFISGFLFFYSSKTYSRKLRSRVRTLLIPYLFWNGLILLAYYLFGLIGHPLLVEGKSVADYYFVDFLRAFIDRGSWNSGNGVPMLCPYWYIRNLMVLSIMSPFLYYGIKYFKFLILFFLFIWWITIPNNGMIASSLLFFCLGAYFSIEQKNPIIVLRQYKILFLCVWIVFFLVDWAHCFWYVPFALYVHRLSLLLNIFMLLYVGSFWGSKHYPGRQLFDKSAFWIYTVHYPITIVIGMMSASYLADIPDWLVFVFYWLSFLSVITLCVVSYAIMHWLCPRLLSYVTGNRS